MPPEVAEAIQQFQGFLQENEAVGPIIGIVALIIVLAIFVFVLKVAWKILTFPFRLLLGGGAGPGKEFDADAGAGLGKEFDADAFTQAFVAGHLRPRKVKHKHDKRGPLFIYVFPEQKVEIHAHFNDERKELVGRAHIKTSSGKFIGFIDNFALAMLRHYAEEA